MYLVICNLPRKQFFQKFFNALAINEAVFVCNGEDVQKAISRLDLQSILLDVDIGWFGGEGEIYTGFNLAIEFRRRYRLLSPILIFSNLPIEIFEKHALTDSKFNILYGNGTYFIKYPFFSLKGIKNIIQEAPNISRAALFDMVTMLCDLRGIVIDRLNHELRFEKPANITKAFDIVRPYFSDYQLLNTEFDKYKSKLKEAARQGDEQAFINIKELLLKTCSLYLTQNEDSEQFYASRKYKILLLDDRHDELKVYTAALSKDFDLIYVTKANEAINILGNDQANSIHAVISDWRLFEDETLTYWQEKQGYEVLEFAARSGFRALFALTSQADFVVHQIRNLLGIRFSMFKKDHLRTADQWRLFRELLHEACGQVTELIAAIPSGTGWTKAETGKKSLNEQYLDKRNSPDWPSFEVSISADCDRIWDYYQLYIAGGLEESLQDFSARFGYILKNNLESILIARRIVIGLYINQGKIYQNILGENYPRIDVYSVFRNKFFSDFLEENQQKNLSDLKGKSIEEYTIDKMISASTGLLNTTLCLDIERLPTGKGMLPEEKAWVIRHGFSFSLQLTDDEPHLSNNAENILPDNGPSISEMRRIEQDINQFFLDEDDEEDY